MSIRYFQANYNEHPTHKGGVLKIFNNLYVMDIDQQKWI